MSKIEQLADAIAPDIPGIPWGEMSRLWGMSPEELVTDTQPPADGQTPMGIQQYQHQMDKAYLRAKAAVDTIDLPWDIGTPEAMQAFDNVKDQTLDVSGAALSAFKQSFMSVLPEGMGMEVSVEEFRAIVASTYMTATYGYLLHRRLVFQRNNVDPRVIIDHAEQVTKAFNLIDMWFKDDVLKPLKTKSPVGAVQIPVIVGVVVVIVAAAIIAAIAWVMVANKKISATNRAMDALCAKAAETNDPAMVAACMELSQQNQVAIDSGPSSIGPERIITWVKWGLVAWITILVVPPAMRAWEAGNKRRALREAAR